MNRSSYSTSPAPNNTALKSPSPDKSRMNVLTPTKIKYLANSQSIKAFDSANTGAYGHRSEAYLSHSKQTGEEYVTKNFNVNVKMGGGKSVNENYVAELEKRVQVLTTENRSLVKKLDGQHMRKNSYVIERIKEQYEEKMATMRMMVEQEVKDAMSIIEDTCQALAHQLATQDNRL